jgi:hypothetical protein
MTMIDDVSRYLYVYLLKTKDEALNCFKTYKAEVENQLEKKIKHFSSDRGGEYFSNEFCDRTTSEIRGLSPKIISGDSRQSENAQTHTYKHTIPYMKFKLKLLQIKCHVLEFTKDEAQKILQR